MQPRHRAQRGWQRRPPGDAPNACPRIRVVGDPWKPPAQLDSSRQLSLLIENGADRGSISLGDDEHPKSMRVSASAGKAPPIWGKGHYQIYGLRLTAQSRRTSGIDKAIRTSPQGLGGAGPPETMPRPLHPRPNSRWTKTCVRRCSAGHRHAPLQDGRLLFHLGSRML
jgi:hypothetical protein